MSSPSRVQQHFDDDASRFDRIYETRKPLFERFVDSKVRGIVVERLRLTRALVPRTGPWNVLDVGCGSGRFDIALVQDGASRAVGIDFAPRMIELAREEARRACLEDRCDFQVAEFLAFEAREKYNVVLAMGYFDYIADPLPHLKKMVEVCGERLLASFPKRWEWRVPVRRMRFALSGSYVRFYDRNDVSRLILGSGLRPEQSYVLDFGRDYILVARP